MKEPLVSVNVLMYNSSEYILETLESIKAQTYQNIELIISDDKSTDDTVDICEEWVSKNKSRFESVKILVPKQNTGQSGNYNRAFRAASGEWIKEIDGDDLLLPNCIEDCINYVKENPNAKYVFGKMTGLGEDKRNIEGVLKRFDYDFFEMTPEEQLHRLLYKGNCVPSPTSFYNKQYMLDLGFECDERIPYMEDWPKWVKLLQLGVKYYYLPIDVASYRVDSGISTKFPSESYFRTNALMKVHYCIPVWLREGNSEGTNRLVEDYMWSYKMASSYKQDLDNLYASKAYKIGHALLTPLRLIKGIFATTK